MWLFLISQLIIIVQLRAQSEANFATVEVNVKDENDNPPSFSSVSILLFINAMLLLAESSMIRSLFKTHLKSSPTRTSQIISCASFLRCAFSYHDSVLCSHRNSFPVNRTSMNVLSFLLLWFKIFFPQNSFTATLYENQDPNTTVSTIVAKDIDEGINSEISYYLNGLSSIFNYFVIFALFPNLYWL